MTQEPSDIVCLTCSIFKREIEALTLRLRWNYHFIFLSSMLHVYPDQLCECLGKMVNREKIAGKRVAMIYGDCQPHMYDIESRDEVARTRGANCCEIVLGSEEYNRLLRGGAFFLMPEWTLRWREVFNKGLGLTGKTLKTFMQEMHSKLVYLDTGVTPVPEALLKEISHYTGLPWETQSVSLERLEESIRDTMERLSAK